MLSENKGRWLATNLRLLDSSRTGAAVWQPGQALAAAKDCAQDWDPLYIYTRNITLKVMV
jgi:hypothetical protein